MLAAGEAYLRFHLEHPGYFQMVALPHAGTAAEGDVAERIARRVEIEVGRVEEVIRRAVEQGELLELDPKRVATFLWGAWNGVVALSMRPDRLRLEEDELVAVIEARRRLVLEGMAPATARRKDARLKASIGFPTAGQPSED